MTEPPAPPPLPPAPPAPPVPPPPTDRRVVSDAQALKALADPLRLQMLGTLGRDPERLWTVKELASALGQPATKLYHHMKLLEAAELVVDAETRLVSGIVEHRYRCAQRSIALDEALIGIPALRDDILGSVVSLVDRTRSDLLRYLHRADVDLEQVGVHHAVVHLTDAERAEALERLEALVEEIVARRDEAERTGAPRYAVFTLMHPFDEPEP